MTDAQYLFDLAAKQYNEIADSIETHFESVAQQIKELLPRTIQPLPPPPRKLPPATYWKSAQKWVSHNRAVVAGIVAFVSTGAVVLYMQRRARYAKRRAKRAANGARTEVVVIAGSPTSSITTALALDLERRGFVVYVITANAEDEHHVRSQSRLDILPLMLDLVYPDAAQDQLGRFHHLLSRHHYAVEGAEPHRLKLAGVILLPDTQSPVASISDLTPDAWSTALNAKVLNTIVTTQLLLPLVTDFRSRLLLLAPSVVPSLRPPQHAVESTVSSALEAFIATLAAELQSQQIPVCHFKLGNLELTGRKHRQDSSAASQVKGTSIRRLHDSVFDALRAGHPSRTWHVGRGSLVYDVIGGLIPGSVVGWMLGFHTHADPVEEDASLALAGSESSAQWEKVEQIV